MTIKLASQDSASSTTRSQTRPAELSRRTVSTSIPAASTSERAEDFLEKRAPQALLLDAVQRALARDAREREARARQHELRGRFDTISAREPEVLGHVLRGTLNKQIAGDLGIVERTVKVHRKALMTKLGVRSVAALIRLVHEAGVPIPR